MSQSGKCLCGAVKFTADGVKTEHSACHCGMCRRWSGGSPFFAVRADSVKFEGEEHIGRYDSSDWGQRGFCKNCGTILFYFFKPLKGYLMSVGAFDENDMFHLGREIYFDRKPSGYAMAGEHPRWTEEETIAKMTGASK